MSATAVAVSVPRKTIAPVWHTVLYVAALAAISGAGLRTRFGVSSRPAIYLFIIASEWLLVALVAWGVHLGGGSVTALIGRRWSRPTAFFRALGLSVLFLIVTVLATSLLAQALGASRNARVLQLLPHTRA